MASAERPPTAAEAFAAYRRWLAAHLIVTAPLTDNRKGRPT